MGDVTVYGVPGSPYVRSALLGFEVKGAPYRLHALGLGDEKASAHLARHPFGRVPTMDHDGFALYGSTKRRRSFATSMRLSMDRPCSRSMRVPPGA
jgi:Glutathione S-transferase, N-terminal domain